MTKFICRLSGDQKDTLPGGATALADVSLCCLVHAETPEAIEAPLRDLLLRMRAKGDALSDIDALYLDDVMGLSDQPGDAVLWFVSTRAGTRPGTSLQLHLPLPIDDSGRIESYGHGVDPAEHEGEDVESEPFIEFKDAPPARARKRPRARKR